MNLSILEKLIGISFRDKNLLKQALTHRSYLNEDRAWPVGHNERLEFLGDAVLELVVSDFLFKRYPNKPEGQLTEYRSALVNVQSNMASANSLRLNEFILTSRGESKDIGRARQIILSDAYEAVIGALYLDQGFEAVQQLIAKLVLSKANDIVANYFQRNTKSRLQEMTQKFLQVAPTYQVLDESGPAHDKQFIVGVFFGSDLIAKGTGPTKQHAEEEAAKVALQLKGWLAIA